ncbi:MAG: hypothetical protein LBC41_03455 [Clostridiales bacterium]|jgi:hypothetical protein|nr:hypothetical protein [Clostridiales bacterium]
MHPLATSFLKYQKAQFEDCDLFDKSYIVRWIWLSVVIAGIFTIALVQAPIHLATGPLAIVSFKTLWNVIQLYLIFSVVMACAVIIPKKGFYKRYIAFFNGLLIMAFLLNVIPSNAAMMDGETIVNDWGYAALRLTTALAVSEAIAFALWRPLKYFPMLLIAMAIVSSVTDHAKTSRYEQANPGDREEDKIALEAATFSSDRNIIVISLDSFQGSAAEEHLGLHPDLAGAFDGFTLFSRAFSTFNFTFYSRPTILSGNVYSSENRDPREEELAALKDSFLTDLGKEGYAVTTLGYNTLGVTESIENFKWYRYRTEDSRDAFFYQMNEYGDLFSASIARLTGIWARNPWDNTQIDPESHLLNMKQDTLSMNEIIHNSISVSEEKRSLFMWWMVLHQPIILDQDGNPLSESHNYEQEYHSGEIYLGLSQLAEFFALLKDNDVYDNSLIIVLSDHGSSYDGFTDHLGKFKDLSGFENNYGNFRRANFYNAVLFVKPPLSRGKLETTNDPAWVGDVRALIDYYDTNFKNMDPRIVEASIRASNPDVPVMYSDTGDYFDVVDDRDFHKFVVVNDLHQIPGEIYKKTGILHDEKKDTAANDRNAIEP